MKSNEINITFSDLWSIAKKYKKLFAKVAGITFVIACALLLCLPNYYQASVTLAPELSGSSSSSSLSSLASSFGIKLGGNNGNGSEALFPTLYPDMMNSVDFKTSLFPIKVHEIDSEEEYTYYEYLLDHQRKPWWITVIGGTKDAIVGFIKSLFTDDEEESTGVNPFMLTKEQADVIKYGIDEKISCDVDQKTLVISISVTDQDPLIAAVMADSVKQRLQDAITSYRTSKARVDLEYNKKMFAETKADYDDARQRYAVFADANQGMVLQSARSKLIELENDMQIKYQAFSTIAAQLQAAEAKVQEATPAFTTLEMATVPVKKAGPGRAKWAILYTFLSILCTAAYVLHKEHYLIPLTRLALGLDGDEEENEMKQ